MADDTGRTATELFPGDYTSWRYCIEVKCGLALTPDFIQARLAVLNDPRHEEVLRFASLYGESYRERVVAWLQRAAADAYASRESSMSPNLPSR